MNYNFTFVVGFWDRKGARKRVVRVVVAKVTAQTWRRLWGRLTRSQLDALARAVSARGEDYEAARRRAKEGKAKLAAEANLIVLNPKIDSKGQRQLQCSLPFDAFFSQIVGENDPQPEAAPTLWGEPVDLELP